MFKACLVTQEIMSLVLCTRNPMMVELGFCGRQESEALILIQDESTLAGHVGERAVRGREDDASFAGEQPVAAHLPIGGEPRGEEPSGLQGGEGSTPAGEKVCIHPNSQIQGKKKWKGLIIDTVELQ
jgi:hypothetical protein